MKSVIKTLVLRTQSSFVPLEHLFRLALPDALVKASTELLISPVLEVLAARLLMFY